MWLASAEVMVGGRDHAVSARRDRTHCSRPCIETAARRSLVDGASAPNPELAQAGFGVVEHLGAHVEAPHGPARWCPGGPARIAVAGEREDRRGVRVGHCGALRAVAGEL